MKDDIFVSHFAFGGISTVLFNERISGTRRLSVILPLRPLTGDQRCGIIFLGRFAEPRWHLTCTSAVR